MPITICRMIPVAVLEKRLRMIVPTIAVPPEMAALRWRHPIAKDPPPHLSQLPAARGRNLHRERAGHQGEHCGPALPQGEVPAPAASERGPAASREHPGAGAGEAASPCRIAVGAGDVGGTAYRQRNGRTEVHGVVSAGPLWPVRGGLDGLVQGNAAGLPRRWRAGLGMGLAIAQRRQRQAGKAAVHACGGAGAVGSNHAIKLHNSIARKADPRPHQITPRLPQIAIDQQPPRANQAHHHRD